MEVARPSDRSPDIHYAKRDGHHLACTLTGNGPVDLVYMLGFVSQLDMLWEDPAAAAFLRRLAVSVDWLSSTSGHGCLIAPVTYQYPRSRSTILSR